MKSLFVTIVTTTSFMEEKPNKTWSVAGNSTNTQALIMMVRKSNTLRLIIFGKPEGFLTLLDV